MEKKIDIHKAGGVLLKNRRFLMTRAKSKDFFIAPGGKVKSGESVQAALKRELKEELDIEVDVGDLEEFGTFYAPAAEDEDKYLQMDVFLVNKWSSKILPAGEVEEILWVNSSLTPNTKVGSIFNHDVLPKLKEENLID